MNRLLNKVWNKKLYSHFLSAFLRRLWLYVVLFGTEEKYREKEAEINEWPYEYSPTNFPFQDFP